MNKEGSNKDKDISVGSESGFSSDAKNIKKSLDSISSSQNSHNLGEYKRKIIKN